MKHFKLHSFLANNTDCTPLAQIQERVQTMQRLACFNTEIKTSFTHCKWTDCESNAESNGGAILCTTAGVSLFFDYCIFLNCCCGSTDYSGGSIYVVSVSIISVTNSVFEYTKEAPQAFHGGAMFVHSVSAVKIYDNIFYKCFISSSGGAAWIGHCSSANSKYQVINNCIFHNSRGTSGYGGGVDAYYNNQYNCFLCNSIFSECSNYYGGGIYLLYTSYPSSTLNEAYPIQYCFFNKNTFVGEGAGNDVHIEITNTYIPSDANPIFNYCLSTTPSNRIGYYNHGYYSKDVNWLPLAFTHVCV